MSKQIDNVKRVYTVSEIMGILSISKTAAYKFIKENPPFDVIKIGESYRILKQSFDNWLGGGGVTA
ncbi:MAG: helix-turn-helix domain-containing protein [Ruminococcus sp.]|nr:helix-turn-helix domain-containing protein [Ruminococcus sp.]